MDAPYEVALTAAALAATMTLCGRHDDAHRLQQEADEQFERLGVKHPPLLRHRALNGAPTAATPLGTVTR